MVAVVLCNMLFLCRGECAVEEVKEPNINIRHLNSAEAQAQKMIAEVRGISYVDQNIRKDMVYENRSSLQTSTFMGGSSPGTSLVTLSSFAKPRFISPTPFFQPTPKKRFATANTFLFLDTVRKFISVCASDCETLQGRLQNHTLLKHHYVSFGGEIDEHMKSLLGEPSRDLERAPDFNTLKIGLRATKNCDRVEHIDRDHLVKVTAKVKTAQPITTLARPLTLVAEGSDTKDYLRPLGNGHESRIEPALPAVLYTQALPQALPKLVCEMFATDDADSNELSTIRLLVPKGADYSVLDQTPAKVRQNMCLALKGNAQKFVEKCKIAEQQLTCTVDEAFEIEFLLSRKDNPYLRRLFEQTFPKYMFHPYSDMAFMFWHSTAFSTMKENYGPQIKHFVDFLNLTSKMSFQSVAQFVRFLSEEVNRKLIAKFVPQFFRLKVRTRSADSSKNWWAGLNKCYRIHGRKLAHYVSPDIKKACLRALFSEREPTDGLYAKEWVLLIQWCFQGPLKRQLLGLFLVYMMRLGMRAHTVAKLRSCGPLLIRDPKSKTLAIHQWGLMAKNCKRHLGDVPTFRMIKQEPISPLQPYICAVWALQRICEIRHSLNVRHDSFLFSDKGLPMTPKEFRELIQTTLKKWQKQTQKICPLLKVLNMGAHTPRKTFVNIATYFNLSEPEIKMMMASTWPSIKASYVETSRAFNDSQPWTKLLACFEMTESKQRKLYSKLTKPIPKVTRRLVDEFDDLALYD